MGHDLLEVVRVHCVQYVKEIVTWRALALRILAREVPHHLGVLLKHREHRLDRELVVLLDLYECDVLPLQEILPALEHVLQEVFVDG